MEVDGQKRFPLLCFTDKFLNIGDTTKSVEPIQLPARDFEFHGAAHSVVSDFFDSQGEELKVPIGVYEEN